MRLIQSQQQQRRQIISSIVSTVRLFGRRLPPPSTTTTSRPYAVAVVPPVFSGGSRSTISRRQRMDDWTTTLVTITDSSSFLFWWRNHSQPVQPQQQQQRYHSSSSISSMTPSFGSKQQSQQPSFRPVASSSIQALNDDDNDDDDESNNNIQVDPYSNEYDDDITDDSATSFLDDDDDAEAILYNTNTPDDYDIDVDDDDAVVTVVDESTPTTNNSGMTDDTDAGFDDHHHNNDPSVFTTQMTPYSTMNRSTTTTTTTTTTTSTNHSSSSSSTDSHYNNNNNNNNNNNSNNIDDDVDHQERVEQLRNSRARFIVNTSNTNNATATTQRQQQQQQQQNQHHHPTVIHYIPMRKASLVQDRVAAHQLQYMEERTNHILDQKSFRTIKVTTTDIQRVYLYWLSRPVRDMFYNSKNNNNNNNNNNTVDSSIGKDRGDYNTVNTDLYRPIYRALEIVNWFMYQFDHADTTDDERHMIANAMMTMLNSNGETKNTGLCRLMSFFCQPLQGTNATIKEYGARRTENDGNNVKFYVSNLVCAARVHTVMQRMHEDHIYFPNVVPDGQSYQSILNLTGKRCRLLVLLGPRPQVDGVHFPRIRRGIRWSDAQTIDALGGCGDTRDCIDMALRVIRQMKSNPTTHPSMIHYAVVLSMMSYAAGLNIGAADEAYTILKGIQDDPTIEDSIALYNPVLLAYVMEADEHQKRQRWEQKRTTQQKCELLWGQMRNHKNPTVTSDPISYSIMIKLYRNLDEAAKAQEILESMEAAAVARSSAHSLSSVDTTEGMNDHVVDSTVITHHNSPDPSLMHYNSVLNAWAKSSDPQSGERAMALVRRMEEKTLAISGMHHPIVPRPDHVSFTSTLDALLRGPNVAVTIAHMEQILQRFEASEEVERRPDSVTYNVIFHSLNRQLRQQREEPVRAQIADEMEQLLYRLQSQSANFRLVAGPRLFRYYNECLRAWAGTNTPERPSRALRLVRKMDEVCNNGSFPSARPNGTTYQHLLFAIAGASDLEYTEFSKEIFTKMEQANVPITVTALLAYVGRLLRCRFDGTPDEADDAFVQTLMERFRAKKDRNDAFVAGMVFEGIFTNINKEVDLQLKLRWTRRYEKLFRALVNEPEYLRLNDQGQNLAFFYSNCIKAWAFARTQESTANALRLLREMEDTSRTSGIDRYDLNSCSPNVKTYEYVLTCLTRIPDLISVNTAREIFHKMELAKIPITVSLLNRFIRILSQSGASGALHEAEHILKIVEDDFLAKRNGSLCPNYMAYSNLVEGHMRSQKGLVDAERILDHMKSLSEKNGLPELRPAAKLYIDLINRWSESVSVEAIERVDCLFKKMAEISKPSNYEYSILQSAWCRSKRPDAPHQVESILVSMQQDYESGNNLAARPAIENFDLVIKAWATSQLPNAVERADAILRRLEDLCYSDRGAYASMKPSTSCYQHALLGWTLVDSPVAGERALAILDRMKQNETLGAPSINQACYHHAIAAIGKSNTTNKAAKCYTILEEMRIAYESRRNRYSWPTHETFQSILGVCATCTNSVAEKEMALDVSVKTMKEYLQVSHMGPRKDVYIQFLYAVFRLLPAGTERDNVVLSIFADERYICPAAIFDAIHVRDALTKTVSPKVLADIARICGRNPLLKSLNRGRVPSMLRK